jgi:hypothetical protein
MLFEKKASCVSVFFVSSWFLSYVVSQWGGFSVIGGRRL